MKILFRLLPFLLLSTALPLKAKIIYAGNDADCAKGDAAFAKHDWATAVECYSAALRHVPYFDAYINRASAYVGLGKFDEAIADFDTAISKNNDAVFSDVQMRYIRYNRAQAYMGKKDYANAIDDISYVISKTERSALPFLERGYCQMQLGRLKEAHHDIKVALEVSPRNARANMLRLRLCRKEGDAAATRRQLDHILALVEKSPSTELCNGAAWFLATSPDEHLRDGPRAVLYATKACELSRWKEPKSIDTLAVACAEAGDFANAIKWEQDYLGRDGLTEAERHAASTQLELFQHSTPYRETDLIAP